MRNSSLVERQGIDDDRALSIPPKLRIAVYCDGRGAFYSAMKVSGDGHWSV